MDSIFIRNFAVFNFLKVFYIVILDDGVFGPKRDVTCHSTSGNIYVVIEGLYTSVTPL